MLFIWEGGLGELILAERVNRPRSHRTEEKLLIEFSVTHRVHLYWVEGETEKRRHLEWIHKFPS